MSWRDDPVERHWERQIDRAGDERAREEYIRRVRGGPDIRDANRRVSRAQSALERDTARRHIFEERDALTRLADCAWHDVPNRPPASDPTGTIDSRTGTSRGRKGLAAYLDDEKELGRVSASADTQMLAFTLLASVHHLFFTEGEQALDPRRVRHIVASLVTGLATQGARPVTLMVVAAHRASFGRWR